MTTRTTAAVFDQSTDAGFQQWITEFVNILTSVGLVQTADTGQLNPATATRPGTNTSAGYLIFRMNDSMQGSAPIYFRFEPGAGSAANNPRMLVRIGTGTNGAGTLTGGDNATIYTPMLNTTPVSTTTNYTSYACAVDGAFWISWKNGGGGGVGSLPCILFVFSRFTDSTGAPTAGGYSVIYSGSSTTITTGRSYNTVTSTGFNASTLVSMGGQPAWGVSSSLVSGQPQVYQMTYITPRVQPQNFLGLVLGAEVALGVQYQATMTGSTLRNYINGSHVVNGGSQALGLIWE